MSNDNNSIHDFDFNLICEYFSALERQGPGSKEVTLQALAFTGVRGDDARIADIGCGTGGQTLFLAENTPGQITAIDLFPGFIDILNRNAANAGLNRRIKGVVGNMESLPFGDEELDLIWSEGAIYNIGYRRGLREWFRFLKPGGYIAVTEASWFTETRPEEIEKFWNDAYPEIDTISAKVAQMQEAGFIPAAHFILPECCWTENFYLLQKTIQPEFLKKHAGNKMAEYLVANERHEASLYAQYKNWYGYVFYIGMKPKNSHP
jgi:ubiquinone/menaquinone biosynthesis C-methylase UbiE